MICEPRRNEPSAANPANRKSQDGVRAIGGMNPCNLHGTKDYSYPQTIGTYVPLSRGLHQQLLDT